MDEMNEIADAGVAEEVDAEVLEAGEQDAEPPAPETRRRVRFLFDDKMMEFDVNWTSQQLMEMISGVTADDGFFWVPRDEERDTGSFVNLNNCTGVTLDEDEVPIPMGQMGGMPPMPGIPDEAQELVQEAEDSRADACRSFLDQCAKDNGLPTEPSFREKSFRKFYIALIRAKFPEIEDAELALDDWLEGEYQDEVKAGEDADQGRGA